VLGTTCLLSAYSRACQPETVGELDFSEYTEWERSISAEEHLLLVVLKKLSLLLGDFTDKRITKLGGSVNTKLSVPSLCAYQVTQNCRCT
jgi:hypothetical protein